jgi:hypothetical protein
MKTCLVCGNGPSLADARNDVLDQFITFGANRIYLKYTPTYYVFVDPMVGRSNVNFIKEINRLETAKYIGTEFASHIDDCVPLNVIHHKGFSYNPLDYVYGYFSVTTVMLQLAYMFGFERVGLVGMDHKYHLPRGERQFHYASEDRNHFVQDYYQGYLDKWNAPKLDKLEEWFDLAKHEFEEDGREIINLTPDSALKIFKFERIEDWYE